MAQWVKAVALSLQQLQLLLCCRSDPWPGNFCMLWARLKKKKKQKNAVGGICFWGSGREPGRVPKLDQLSGGGDFRQRKLGRHQWKEVMQSLEAGTQKRGHGGWALTGEALGFADQSNSQYPLAGLGTGLPGDVGSLGAPLLKAKVSAGLSQKPHPVG